MGINYVTRPANTDNKLNVISSNTIFEHAVHIKICKTIVMCFYKQLRYWHLGTGSFYILLTA
jgi:hypothetical protein